MSGEAQGRGLIDTSVVIHLAALDDAHLPDEMVISAVTLAELSFDTEAARTFGLVSAAVVAAGRKPRRRIADLMIASIAIANRLPLYTTNPSDFAGLDDLATIVPVPATVIVRMQGRSRAVYGRSSAACGQCALTDLP